MDHHRLIAEAKYLSFTLDSAAKHHYILQTRLIETDQIIATTKCRNEKKRYKWIRRLVIHDIHRSGGEIEALLAAVDSCRLQIEEILLQWLAHRQYYDTFLNPANELHCNRRIFPLFRPCIGISRFQERSRNPRSSLIQF